MEVITINNKKYVEGDYVKCNAPIYSKGCRSSREIIRKHKISCDNYIYARFENNEWKITDGKSVKFDKVMLLESFVKNIIELNVKENDEGEIIKIETYKKRKIHEHNAELIKEIENLNKQIEILKIEHKNEIALLKKDFEIELLRKELEYSKMYKSK
jgi:hypothetical protein